MQVVNSLYDGVKSYYHDIPSNTLTQMVVAAGAAFVVETIVSGNLNYGAIAAGLSATATAIHGLVTPIFKKITGGRMHLTWGEEMCRTFTAIIGAGAVAKAYGNNSIFDKLVFLSLLYGFLSYVDPHRRDLSRADWIPIFPRFVAAP